MSRCQTLVDGCFEPGLGYIGSITSSTITGIVFGHDVTDSGMDLLGGILAGVSLALLALTVFDRIPRTPKASS